MMATLNKGIWKDRITKASMTSEQSVVRRFDPKYVNLNAQKFETPEENMAARIRHQQTLKKRRRSTSHTTRGRS